MPPADVLGGGERVSRCSHTVGFRGLGAALSSCVSPHPRYRVVGGCHSPPVAAQRGRADVRSRGRSPAAGMWMLMETPPAWGASLHP